MGNRARAALRKQTPFCPVSVVVEVIKSLQMQSYQTVAVVNSVIAIRNHQKCKSVVSVPTDAHVVTDQITRGWWVVKWVNFPLRKAYVNVEFMYVVTTSGLLTVSNENDVVVPDVVLHVYLALTL